MNRLKSLRRKKHLTQQQLSKELKKRNIKVSAKKRDQRKIIQEYNPLISYQYFKIYEADELLFLWVLLIVTVKKLTSWAYDVKNSKYYQI